MQLSLGIFLVTNLHQAQSKCKCATKAEKSLMQSLNAFLDNFEQTSKNGNMKRDTKKTQHATHE